MSLPFVQSELFCSEPHSGALDAHNIDFSASGAAGTPSVLEGPLACFQIAGAVSSQSPCRRPKALVTAVTRTGP
jgi:hypothetical protein